MAATEKAKLLQAAKLRKGLTLDEIAAIINADRPKNNRIHRASVQFAVSGSVGKGRPFHGIDGDGVSLLVAKALGVPRKTLLEAHYQDKERQRLSRPARERKVAQLRKKAESRRTEILSLIAGSKMQAGEAMKLADVIRNLDYQAILALDANTSFSNSGLQQMLTDLYGCPETVLTEWQTSLISRRRAS